MKDLVAQATQAAKAAGISDKLRKTYLAEVQKAAQKARKKAMKKGGEWASPAQWRALSEEERAAYRQKRQQAPAAAEASPEREDSSPPHHQGERAESPRPEKAQRIEWVCVEVEDTRAPAAARLDWVHVSDLKGQRAWADPDEAQLALQERAVALALRRHRSESARQARNGARRVAGHHGGPSEACPWCGHQGLVPRGDGQHVSHGSLLRSAMGRLPGSRPGRRTLQCGQVRAERSYRPLPKKSPLTRVPLKGFCPWEQSLETSGHAYSSETRGPRGGRPRGMCTSQGILSLGGEPRDIRACAPVKRKPQSAGG